MGNKSVADEFLKKYDVNCIFRTLINTIMSLDLDKLQSEDKDRLDFLIKNLIGLFDNATESISALRDFLISEINKRSNQVFSITVSDGEWFYYADCIDTPMFIIKNKAFRYVNGNIYKQSLSNGWKICKTLDDRKYVITHDILPLTKMKVDYEH